MNVMTDPRREITPAFVKKNNRPAGEESDCTDRKNEGERKKVSRLMSLVWIVRRLSPHEMTAAATPFLPT